MDAIRTWDTRVFFSINHLPHTRISDLFMEACSGFGYAWLLWLIIAIVLFIRKQRRDHWFWVPLVIAGMLTYIGSEIGLKTCIARIRPDILPGAIVVGIVPSSFSFPSTHATVAFVCAYLFSRKEAHWLWLYGLAFLVCFSRIYLGHHYPIDVVFGMVLGTGIGWVSMQIDMMLHTLYRRIHHPVSKKGRKQV